MEKRVQAALQLAGALQKQPDRVPWMLDEPWTQHHYSWDTTEEAWTPQLKNQVDAAKQSSKIDAVALYSWNVDFMLPFAESRMKAALAHLEKLIGELPSPSTTAVVINLQECIPSDLITLSQQQWVRERFYMTELDTSAWANGAYGTTMLVDRSLDVTSCFRVHYSKTIMQRDALFVDVSLPTGTKETKKLRLGNSHLESLALDPPQRPAQVQTMGSHMKAEGVDGSIAAGDFNAIQPFDRTLHADNGLKDAYLELGGKEDDQKGYTWGQQALKQLREQFGLSRMDKCYFCGDILQLQSFERFGEDVALDGTKKSHRDELISLGFEKAWVTDHLGIKAVFNLKDRVRL